MRLGNKIGVSKPLHDDSTRDKTYKIDPNDGTHFDIGQVHYRLSNKFKKLDMFGVPVTLTHRGRDSFKTK